MLRRVALVRIDVSEEPGASFIRVTRIGELGTTQDFITTKLLDFVHRPDFYKQITQRFGNWICFRLQARGGGTYSTENPKACLSTGDARTSPVEIRTMDKVQKLNSNECYTPSSEPFRMYFLVRLETN
jgi:hypothetical protein